MHELDQTMEVAAANIHAVPCPKCGARDQWAPGAAAPDVVVCGSCGHKALMMDVPEEAEQLIDADPNLLHRLLQAYRTDPQVRAAVDQNTEPVVFPGYQPPAQEPAE